MNTDFKVYKRKIHVFYRNALTLGHWRYCYSSNAYRTCRDAVAAAQAEHPNVKFKAHFAKD